MMGCGIDEAGRGPVIGPMVIAGVCADRNNLIKIGVKDSKKLSPKRREILAEKIKNLANKVVIKVIEPEDIDSLRENYTLNKIEAQAFAEVIKKLGCKEVYVDAADVDEERFARAIKEKIDYEIAIISKHKADEIYPEVSAASIIAKVERDRRVRELIEEIGDFGSGYPSDPRTINFLEDYYKKHGNFPPHTRLSWRNTKKIKEKNYQKKIEEF